MSGRIAIAVTADGLVRGAELAGAWELRVEELDLVLVPATSGRRRATIGYEEIDGLRVSQTGDWLALYLAGGDVLELASERNLAAAAREIGRRACETPELTRPLRALGSHRGGPGAAHERFFAVLLEARRAVERSEHPVRRVAAFDAAALGGSVSSVLSRFAAELHPASDPDRRALEEALRDESAPLFAALQGLAAAAREVREGDDDVRYARWRDWTRAVLGVFEAADRSWLALRPLLESPVAAPRRKPLWRRMLRLGAVAIAMLPAAAGAQRSTWELSGVRADSLVRLGFDVVGQRDGRALVVADSAALAELSRIARVERELVTASVRRLRTAGPRAATATVVYRSFDDPVRGIRAHLDSLAAANPLVHVDSIGATHEGRPLLAVKIGAADDSPSRPNVLYLATYHAREWAATEMALRLIRHLAGARAPSARVDSLVAARDIWVIPVANPDGYEFTFTTERLWRKNRRPFAGGIGADLNRNHSSHWGWDDEGSSPSPTSEVYRGPQPASESETAAIERFHAEHPPVASVSYHTFTGLVLHPPGYEYALLPGDRGIYRALAGTDVHPSVRDRLPGSERTWYHPAPGWNLYPTNGDYNDFAYEQHGTISFTPELTSGFENGVYYGFEFPDDEAKLQTVFEDNLPFALDVLESARDPLGYRSPTTGLAAERLMLESVSPDIRAVVPASAPVELLASGAAQPVLEDTADFGRYTRRVRTPQLQQRPAVVTVRAGALVRSFRVLTISGAEPGDGGWTGAGFVPSPLRVRTGTLAWLGTNGTLRSPTVAVPQDADTVSVLFWTSYDGDAFSLGPHAEVRWSTDGGATWALAERISGRAEAFYTELARITGVAGRSLQVELRTEAMRMFVDEIALVAHGVATAPPLASGFAPSANPVRGDRVTFAWPFAGGGDLFVYDFAGRMVARSDVLAGAPDVTWDLDASGAANGAYIAIARSGGETRRVKLFVLRGR